MAHLTTRRTHMGGSHGEKNNIAPFFYNSMQNLNHLATIIKLFCFEASHIQHPEVFAKYI